MSKVKLLSWVTINDSKNVNGNAIKGQVIDRLVVKTDELTPDGKHNMYKVTYMIKPENATDFSEYRVLDKTQFTVCQKEEKTSRENSKTYKMNDGSILTLFAVSYKMKYDNINDKCCVGNIFKMGWSLCSINDQFSSKVGTKIARGRAYHHPFCVLVSPYSAEFDSNTMYAIMDVKAKYVDEHIELFNQPGCGSHKSTKKY